MTASNVTIPRLRSQITTLRSQIHFKFVKINTPLHIGKKEGDHCSVETFVN